MSNEWIESKYIMDDSLARGMNVLNDYMFYLIRKCTYCKQFVQDFIPKINAVSCNIMLVKNSTTSRNQWKIM